MDYETKATNRKELRLYAKLFRSICGFSPDESIDPIALLDKLPVLKSLKMYDTKLYTATSFPKTFLLNAR